MGSLVKTYTEQKKFGKVYTPSTIVCKMLDDIGFNSPTILEKTILDPACGDGRFLIEVVKRILKYVPKNNIEHYLTFVYGWDIDAYAIAKCIENLNALIAPYNICISWNLHVKDSIKLYNPKNNLPFFSRNEYRHFDYIVGNPPYIRIQHLEENQRKYIQKKYTFCKSGSTDIYIAFYELCFSLLSAQGVCGLITPNSFMWTETGRQLRIFFAAQRNICQITNFAEIQLFENISTYTAIVIFNRQKNTRFLYQKAITQDSFNQKYFNFSDLKEPFWQLSVHKIPRVKGKKLKELCDIHTGIQTLCDKVYIFKIVSIDRKYVYAKTKLRGNIKIEKSILKPIVKVSTLKNAESEVSEYILFPYKKIEEKYHIIPENTLKEKYPFTYGYLVSVKNILEKRDNGKPIHPTWYAFGRNHGLDTSFGKKIVFAPINKKPNFILMKNTKTTFYSGYCMKYKGIEEEEIIKQLNSDRMKNFIAISSRDFKNGWKAYNKKIVENFMIQNA